MSAQDLGKRLLAEVEEIRLDDFLSSITLQEDSYTDHFGLIPLDSLLTRLARATPYINKQSPPVVELTSVHPAGGKTHIIYHLTAVGILPTHHGGKQACVTIFDTDGRFSIPRLVQQLKLVASQHASITDEASDELDTTTLEDSLRHVHLFHPQSLASTIATLQTLPTYLFDPSRHFSSQRSLHLIALDSASAFHWQVRADVEDTLPDPYPSVPKPSYAQLASALKSTSKTFRAPIVWTSWHLAPLKTTSYPGPATRSFRPSLPLPMQGVVDLRLVVRKAGVRRLPAEITVEEARREAGSRQAVVEEGKGECFVNKWGMDERVLGALGKGAEGFEFWIRAEGIQFERVAEGGSS